MLKKRLIFTLLVDSGEFMLSRNFRLQAVGDIEWINKNYGFSKVAKYIDELVVLNVSKYSADDRSSWNRYIKTLRRLSSGCFVPIAAGGGVRNIEQISELLKAGADKFILNSTLHTDKPLIRKISSKFGAQSIMASIDFKRTSNNFVPCINGGDLALSTDAKTYLKQILDLPIGEIYLNSIHQDGTGQGLDFDLLATLPKHWRTPIILAGGVGNYRHFLSGFQDENIDAVATANLFNFIGDGLETTRKKLIDLGVNLPMWQ